MDFDSFVESVDGEAPPEEVGTALAGLWWERKGDWERAHEICQDAGLLEGDWVHAYLHRVEGDEGNAAYWYSRARKPFFRGSFGAEWDAMVRELLG